MAHAERVNNRARSRRVNCITCPPPCVSHIVRRAHEARRAILPRCPPIQASVLSCRMHACSPCFIPSKAMKDSARALHPCKQRSLCGVSDPRVLNMRVYVCMCIYPHNFDRGRNVALTCAFGAVAQVTKNILEKDVQKVSFGHLILQCRALHITPYCLVHREPKAPPQ